MNRILPLIAIISIAGVLRFCSITSQSLSLAEVNNLLIANSWPTSVFAASLPSNQNPTFYHIILHYWLVLFGSSALALRSLSTILDLGNIIIVWQITNRLFARRSAHFAAALCAFSPLLTYYAQEAGMYSMLLFLVLLASFILLNSRPRNLDVPQFICLLLVSTLGTWTSLYFVLFFFAITLAVVIEDAFSSKRSWQCVLLFVCTLATLVTANMLSLLTAAQGRLLDAQTALLIPYTAIRYFVGYGIMPHTDETSSLALERFTDNLTHLFAPIVLFALIALFATVRMITQERKSAFYILLPLLLPGILASLISVYYPILSEKGLIVGYPFFILLIIYGLLQLRSTEMGVVLCLCVFAFGYAQQQINPLFGNTDWVAAAEFIKKHDASAPVSVISETARECLKANFLDPSPEIITIGEDFKNIESKLSLYPSLWTIEPADIQSKYSQLVENSGYIRSHEVYLPRGHGLRVTLLTREVED